MSYNFRPYDQSQTYLLPPSILDWVEDGSLERFVSDVIDHLDGEHRLKRFYKKYRRDGWGNSAFHPRMMVKVLVFGYCIGVTSSRKLARALVRDVAFRFLSGNQQPDFRTLARFRNQFRTELEGLFVEVLCLCQAAGLAKLGRVALDGRKVKGNAAMDQNKTKDAIEKEVAAIMNEAEKADQEDDARYGKERDEEELPEEMRSKEDRLRRLKEARELLAKKEQEARELQEQKIATREQEEAATGRRKSGRKPKSPDEVVDPEAKANVTDPQSRILKSQKGFMQGYNGQAMADCETQVIVAEALVQAENDVKQVGPMLARCEEQAGARPDEFIADAGYWSEENAKMETEKTEFFISTIKERKQREAARDADHPKGRIPEALTAEQRMTRKLLTERGRTTYALRSRTIEPVFGQMAMRGLNEFRMRGLEKVRSEWSLWCTTHNLLKLWRAGAGAWEKAVEAVRWR